MISVFVFTLVYGGFGVWCVKHFSKPGTSIWRRVWGWFIFANILAQFLVLSWFALK